MLPGPNGGTSDGVSALVERQLEQNARGPSALSLQRGLFVAASVICVAECGRLNSRRPETDTFSATQRVITVCR